jgi:thioredoxin:protein disulfide reductase
MQPTKLFKRAALLVCALSLVVVPSTRARAPMPQANIDVNAYLATDRAQAGRIVRAAVVLEIPPGFHVNANRLTNKFLIPTEVKLDAPRGLRISPVIYPRAVVRHLGFSKEPVQLYEGRAIMRFNITVPANFQRGDTQLRAHVHFQSCNNEVCYPPTTREVTLPLNVVGQKESVKRINGEYFGRR